MAIDIVPARRSTRALLSTALTRLRRPSPALLVATTALVASVTGNAAAAMLITSNAQVGAHTIAGANAPAGGHQNVIAGSVGNADLHNGAVSAAKIAAGDRPHMLNLVATGDGSHSQTITVKELTIKLHCEGTSTGDSAYLMLTSSVEAEVNWSYVNHDSSDPVAKATAIGFQSLSTGWHFGVVSPGSIPGGNNGLEQVGQVVYHNSSGVITITFQLLLIPDYPNLCEITGTAVPASLK